MIGGIFSFCLEQANKKTIISKQGMRPLIRLEFKKKRQLLVLPYQNRLMWIL